MELTLETKRLVTASVAFDPQGATAEGFDLLENETVVATLPADAVADGRVAFPEREAAVGALLKIRARLVLDSDEKSVE